MYSVFVSTSKKSSFKQLAPKDTLQENRYKNKLKMLERTKAIKDGNESDTSIRSVKRRADSEVETEDDEGYVRVKNKKHRTKSNNLPTP